MNRQPHRQRGTAAALMLAMETATLEPPETSDPLDNLPRSSPRQTWGIVAALLLLVTLGFWPSYEQPAAPMEEGALLVYPELVAHGSVPYRDFENFSGPANLWVLTASYKLAGNNVFTERTVGLVYRLLVVAVVFALLRRSGKALAFGCALFTGCLFSVTQLAAFAWGGAIAPGLAALWLLSNERVSTRKLFIAGLLLGFALLYRVDLFPALLLGSLPLLSRMPGTSRWKLALGMALGISPYALLGFVAGGHQLWSNLILYPLVYGNPLLRITTSAVEPTVSKLLLVFLLVAAVNVVAAARLIRGNSFRADNRELAALLLFATGLVLLRIERLDVFRLFPAIILSFAFLPVSIATLLPKAKPEGNDVWQLTLALATPVALLLTITPATVLAIGNCFVSALNPSMATTIFIEQDDRSFPVPSLQVANITGKLFEHLERASRAGDRLFVGPGDLEHARYNDTFIYYLFPKLKPASYFLEMQAGSANRTGSRLSADVATADWLVLDMAWDTQRTPPFAESNGLNAFVRSNFHLVAQSGPYVLLQHGN